MDKRILDLADEGRRLRLAAIGEPLPPAPRPLIEASDGKLYLYAGPWNQGEANEIREQERQQLLTLPLHVLVHVNAHVRAWVMVCFHHAADES